MSARLDRCSVCGGLRSPIHRHKHERPDWKPSHDDFEGALEGYNDEEHIPAAKVDAGFYPLQNLWRVGRRVGRTIYAQIGAEPSDDDPLIGVMDTPGLAHEAATAHNVMLGQRGDDDA